MPTFEIAPGNNDTAVFCIVALTVDDAALCAARQMFPLEAHRIIAKAASGGRPGLFQAYVPLGQFKSSHGALYQVRELRRQPGQ